MLAGLQIVLSCFVLSALVYPALGLVPHATMENVFTANQDALCTVLEIENLSLTLECDVKRGVDGIKICLTEAGVIWRPSCKKMLVLKSYHNWVCRCKLGLQVFDDVLIFAV